jgi:PUA domain protein
VSTSAAQQRSFSSPSHCCRRLCRLTKNGFSNLSFADQIAEAYPYLAENGILDVILPKKIDLVLIKLPEHVQLLVLDHIPLFFSTRDGGWFPTLRLLHQYPDMMPKLRADKGAIKFVLSGANIMCPGLTSPGATIHDEVEAGTPVAIYAEEKEVAMAVGYAIMSTAEMKEVNKGIGVENLHYLNDGLWKTPKLN